MAFIQPTPSNPTPIEINKSGKTPHDIPSFKLLINPACDTAKRFLFLNDVSLKTQNRLGFFSFSAEVVTATCAASNCACLRVSFTTKIESNNPTTV